MGVSARVNFATRAEWEWRWRTAIELWARLAAIATGEARTEAIAGQARGLVEVGQVNQAKELFSLIADQIEGIEGLAHLAKAQGLSDISAWHWDECVTRFPEQATGFLGKAMLLFEREAFAEADDAQRHRPILAGFIAGGDHVGSMRHRRKELAGCASALGGFTGAISG